MRKTIREMLGVYILCAIILLATLTGCSKSSTLGNPGGEAPAVISIWYSLQGDQEKNLHQELKRISEKRSEILIKAEYIPDDQFAEKVYHFQTGGEGPEILIAARPILHTLYEKGAISPVKAQSIDIIPAAESVFTFNQEIYAAPWLSDVPLLYFREENVPPVHLNELWEKKTPVGISSLDLALLSPWWKAEGGNLMSSGIAVLNSSFNMEFLNKLQFLRAEGLLIVDAQAKNRFMQGEIPYLIDWASEGTTMNQTQINWKCVSLYTILGLNGKSIPDRTVGIANSSIKTTPELEDAVRIVEEELLSIETETEIVKAGSKLPVNVKYYQGGAPQTLNAETYVSLTNSYGFEGNILEWKLFDLLRKTIINLSKDSKVEALLEQAQITALELTNKP